MSNNLIDLSRHRIAKVRENDELRDHMDALLECDGILANAVEQMWYFADRREILETRSATLSQSLKAKTEAHALAVLWRRSS
jgi:hypothetical protein